MVQGEEATLELLVAHEQLAEAVEPTVADLDHPSTSLLPGLPLLGLSLLAPVYDVGNVAMRFHDADGLGAAEAGVGTQVLAAPHRRLRALDDDGAEHLIDALGVIDVGPGHDDRQGDATPVHQQVPLAPIFFPDPSGCAPQPLAPTAL